MSDYNEFVRSAAGVFSELYPTPQATRRLLDSAGIDTAQVNLSDPALHRWLEILKQAVAAGKVDALLAAARRDYPAHAGLRALSERRATDYPPPSPSWATRNAPFKNRPKPPSYLPPVSSPSMPTPARPSSALAPSDARSSSGPTWACPRSCGRRPLVRPGGVDP